MTWREDDHPRDGRGRFADKASGGWVAQVSDQIDGRAPRRNLIADRDSWNWRGARSKAHAREYAMDGSHRDHELAEIYREQGFHAKPELVDRERMDELIRGGAQPLYRGLTQLDRGPSLGEMIRGFQEGEEHYAGIGVFGNGTYTSPNVAMAQRYSSSESHPTNPGGIIRMALKPGARVVDYETLYKRLRNDLQEGKARALNDAIFARLDEVGDDPERKAQLIAELKTENRRLAESYDKNWDDFIADAGRYAALLGYDAIAAGPDMLADRYEEVVILNRGALYVDRSPSRSADAELRLHPRRGSPADLQVEPDD